MKQPIGKDGLHAVSIEAFDEGGRPRVRGELAIPRALFQPEERERHRERDRPGDAAPAEYPPDTEREHDSQCARHRHQIAIGLHIDECPAQQKDERCGECQEMKQLLSIFLLIIFGLPGFPQLTSSQQRELALTNLSGMDSLMHALPQMKEDTLKAMALSELAWTFALTLES